jgi:putative addiction module component (TIGR02574 family)
MSRAVRKIVDDALALPDEDRLAIAAELIDSVEGPDDAEWTSAWSAEIDRRVAEADRTGDRGQPWSQVRAELLERLARR